MTYQDPFAKNTSGCVLHVFHILVRILASAAVLIVCFLSPIALGATAGVLSRAYGSMPVAWGVGVVVAIACYCLLFGVVFRRSRSAWQLVDWALDFWS